MSVRPLAGVPRPANRLSQVLQVGWRAGLAAKAVHTGANDASDATGAGGSGGAGGAVSSSSLASAAKGDEKLGRVRDAYTLIWQTLNKMKDKSKGAIQDDGELEDLKTAVDEMLKELGDPGRATRYLNEKIKESESRFRQLKQAREDLDTRSEVDARTLEMLESLDQASQMLNEEEREFLSSISRLMNINRDLLRNHQDDASQLYIKGELEKAKSYVEESSNKLQAVLDEVKRVVREVRKVKRRLERKFKGANVKALEEAIAFLKSDAERANVRMVTLKQQQSDYNYLDESNRAEARELLTELNKASNTAQETLKRKNAELESTKDSILALKARIQQQQDLIDEQSKIYDDLEHKNDQVESLNSTVTKQVDVINQQSKMYDELEEEKQELKAQIAQLKSRDGDAGELQAELAKVSALQAEIETLKSKIQERKEETTNSNRNLVGKINVLRAEKGRLQKELDRKEEDLERALEEIQDSDTKHRDEISELERKILQDC
jgi:chromosome segregation ATPase